MFRSMCRHDGPMTMAAEIGSVESACCPPTIFSLLRSSVSVPPSIPALRRTLDLALPPLCAACREPVEGRGLCPGCWSKLSFITRPYCERLGTPFVYDPGPGILSMEAIADPPAYNRARAAVRFDKI